MLLLGPFVSAYGLGDFSCGAGSCLLRFPGAVSARLGTLGLSFCSHVILDFLFGFRVDPVLLGSMELNLHGFMVSPGLLLGFIWSSIASCSEKMRGMISIFWSLLRLGLCPNV